MFDVPTPKTKNPHESTWDHHGSYQWTYFVDEIKQRIKYFLLQRLHGKNIEVGGGWYLSYPDSVVVDLSSVCLEYNPAKEKLQFDLDTLGEGKKLPYRDHSFNSATLISVWQYLKYPKEVVGELERILIPGAELYLINGQGAGLEECIVGRNRTENLQEFFQELGYDTLIEHIPSCGGRLSEFQSLCVAMPDIDLFGKTSRMWNKEQRKKQDKEVCQDSLIFTNEYIDWEMRNISSKLAKLSSFPVTKYSQEYLERIEAFSKEYNKQTGGIPLVFVEQGFKPELAMLLPDYNFLNGIMFLIGGEGVVENGFNGPENEILKKYDLGFARYCNYFNKSTTTSLLDYCTNFKLKQEDYYRGSRGNEEELRKFANFIASLGLNSFTRQLQQQVYDRLQLNVPDLDEEIQCQRALGYSFATHEHKQERKIDNLISIKQKIKSEKIQTIRTEELDYFPIIPSLRKFIQ